MPPNPTYKNYAVDHILHDRPIRSEVTARSPENAARAVLKQVPETKITRVTDLATGQWWGGVVTHPDSQGHPDGKKEETKPESRTADEEIKQHNAEYNEWVKQNSAQWAKKKSPPAETQKSLAPGRKLPIKTLSLILALCVGIPTLVVIYTKTSGHSTKAGTTVSSDDGKRLFKRKLLDVTFKNSVVMDVLSFTRSGDLEYPYAIAMSAFTELAAISGWGRATVTVYVDENFNLSPSYTWRNTNWPDSAQNRIYDLVEQACREVRYSSAAK